MSEEFVKPFVWQAPATLPTRMASAGLSFDERTNEVVFDAMNYGVDLDEINEPADLLSWVIHLGRKNWVSAEQLAEMVRFIARQKGWAIR